MVSGATELRPATAKEGKEGLLPAVSRAVSYRDQAPTATDGVPPPGSGYSSPRNTLVSSSGIVVALNDDFERDLNSRTPPPPVSTASQQLPSQSGALPFDEEAKLVYGVILSLRTLVGKLSKRYAVDA